MIERFAVAEITTPLTFVEDIALLVEAQVGGMGVWEYKLGRGSDAPILDDFRASGLRATLAVPTIWSILPDPLCPSPVAAADRIDLMCASVRRLAPFDPVAIGVHTGPMAGTDGLAPRHMIVHGLRKLARTAATLHPGGIFVAIEPVAAELRRGDLISSLSAAADLIDEVAEPNLKIVLDAWQIGASVSDRELERHVGRIAMVQLSTRKPSGSWHDRAVPGESDVEILTLVQRLCQLGYQGWYELEVWSREPPLETPMPGAAGATETARLVRGAHAWFRHLYGGVIGVALE